MCKLDMEYDLTRDRIFALLKERKLTQKELAEKLNVSPQTITDWKKKKSNSFMGMVGKLSSALQTTPSWLCFGAGPKYMADSEKAEKDKLVLQAMEAHSEKVRQDAISSMEAALEAIKKCGGFPTLISEYPNFIENAAQILGITSKELLGEEATADHTSEDESAKGQIMADFWGSDQDLTDEDKEAKKKAPPVSGEAMEVAEAYDAADPYLQLSVRKLLDLDAQRNEIRIAARRSDGPRTSTGPDTDVEI